MPSWPTLASSIDASSPSHRSISPCTISARKMPRRLRGDFEIRFWKKFFCQSTQARHLFPTLATLNGYDAGYYGYAWADAIAADMATVFEKAKDGYLDKQAGLRLRRAIYEPGDSSDVHISIETFLGRTQSIQPFLKKIGLGPPEKKKAPAGPSQEGR